MIDIATRVWNHTWKIDPIVRSLLDTDFYKLLMCQSVFRNRPSVRVTFRLINRSHDIRLAELIDEGELREQLDHIRTLALTRGESTWLRGNTFYGKRQMFSPAFMEWFERLRLPPYHLERKGGQFELAFEGPWPEVMLWEIPALAVIMELRSRAVLKDMGRFELQILYARAMSRVWEKGERLRRIEGLRLADFGTRRRHGFLWQDWCVQAMIEALGPKFVGTSNCLIAKNNAPDIPDDRWFAMTRLDQNRAQAQLAKKAGAPVADVKNVAIWGNHSATQFPDFGNATIGGKPATEVIGDDAWLQGEFISTVQKRGAAIIEARGLSSAASAANAAIDSVNSVWRPTESGDCASLAVVSQGQYGVPEGLVFGYPIRSTGDSWSVAEDFELDDFAKDKIRITTEELVAERDEVQALLG